MRPYCHLVAFIDKPQERSEPILIAIIEFDGGGRHVHPTVGKHEDMDVSVPSYSLVRMVLDSLHDDHAERRHPFSMGAHICVGDPLRMSADAALQALQCGNLELAEYVWSTVED
jgi:hypothetical protein